MPPTDPAVIFAACVNAFTDERAAGWHFAENVAALIRCQNARYNSEALAAVILRDAAHIRRIAGAWETREQARAACINTRAWDSKATVTHWARFGEWWRAHLETLMDAGFDLCDALAVFCESVSRNESVSELQNRLRAICDGSDPAIPEYVTRWQRSGGAYVRWLADGVLYGMPEVERQIVTAAARQIAGVMGRYEEME